MPIRCEHYDLLLDVGCYSMLYRCKHVSTCSPELEAVWRDLTSGSGRLEDQRSQ